MRTARKGWAPAVATAFLCLWNASAAAQSADVDHPGDVSSLGGWAGIARHSPEGPFGRSVGNDLAIAAVRLTRTLHRSASWSLDYSADLIPAVRVSMAASIDTIPVQPCKPADKVCVFREVYAGHRGVYGFGAAPFGLQLRLAPGARLQPFVTSGAGGLWFRDPVPHPLAGRFNFTAEVGAGVLYHPTRSLGVMVGYKLQHISNGGTRPYNPGIDNNLFYLGLVRLAHSSSGGAVI